MSEARVNNLSNESNTGGPTITGITTFSGTNFFVPPVGNTAQRPINAEKGSLRYNSERGVLEYYRGDVIGWVEVEASNDELGGGTGSNAGTGHRGLFFNGSQPGDSEVNNIDFITISTLGNSQDFGDSTVATRQGTALSSATRGLQIGGYDGSSRENTIGYVTISSTGNAADFGDLSQTVIGNPAGLASATRGISAGGESPGNTNEIEYVTIASFGNGKDFGDLQTAAQGKSGGGSSTRGVIAGVSTPSVTNQIDYITIATTGNAQDFGDLTQARRGGDKGQASNATRWLMVGGQTPSVYSNVIDYVTIATTGNATDFGDYVTTIGTPASMASPTRVVWAGGHSSDPTTVTTITYVEILTTGNTKDFGDIDTARSSASGCSNGHGGL